MRAPEAKAWFWPLLLAAAIAASVLFVDQPLAALMASNGPGLRALAEEVTWFGRSTGWLIFLAILGLAFLLAARLAQSRRRRAVNLWLAGAAAYLWLAVVAAGLTNDLFKLVGRPRPQVHAAGLSPFHFGYDFESFPSGHTAVGFALAFAIARLEPRWRWAGLLFACAVAASRVILDVHYLGDVLGGALVALVVVRLLTLLSARVGLVFRRLPDGSIRRRFATLRF